MQSAFDKNQKFNSVLGVTTIQGLLMKSLHNIQFLSVNAELILAQ